MLLGYKLQYTKHFMKEIFENSCVQGNQKVLCQCWMDRAAAYPLWTSFVSLLKVLILEYYIRR